MSGFPAFLLDGYKSFMAHRYAPEQARTALDGFFRTENLAALRELALHLMADETIGELGERRLPGEGAVEDDRGARASVRRRSGREHLVPRRGVLVLVRRRLDQALVHEVKAAGGATLLCGRIEGVDERLLQARPVVEVSLGDFVLSGGEIAAYALIVAVMRLLPGVMGA